MTLKQASIGIVALCIFIFGWYVRAEVYREVAQESEVVTFTIEAGESVSALATRLESEQIVRSSFFFTKYLQLKGLDRNVRAGNFTVEAPITLARVAAALNYPSEDEREITIIPGWTLRDVATYAVAEELATEAEVYALTGAPADTNTIRSLDVAEAFPVFESLPDTLSLEGYLRPDTYRVFTDSTFEAIVTKLVSAQASIFTKDMLSAIAASGRSVHEVLTIASLLEKEVRGVENKKIVADIFWRRYDNGWPMQADSTVHYVHGTNGDVFTTKEMRDSLNAYNTYKYSGLPPGPIGTPSPAAIEAAVYPEENEYWYFITTLDTGEAKYAETLAGHNANVQKYLR